MNQPSVSDCCFAETKSVEQRIGTSKVITYECTDCGDQCLLTHAPCPLGLCNGSGETPVYDTVEPGGPSYLAGTRPCPHLTD